MTLLARLTEAGTAGAGTAREYSPHEDRPLRGYLLVAGGYLAATATVAVAARLAGRRLPERIPLRDLAVLGVATHRLSRLISKDTVTSPLRAPFVRYEAPAGESELIESPRGSGVRHAVGELVSCPFCLTVWVATGLTAGMVFAPRLTRLVAGAATSVTAANFLHLAYDAAKKAAKRG